jgi:hypothetical protein
MCLGYVLASNASASPLALSGPGMLHDRVSEDEVRTGGNWLNEVVLFEDIPQLVEACRADALCQAIPNPSPGIYTPCS